MLLRARVAVVTLALACATVSGCLSSRTPSLTAPIEGTIALPGLAAPTRVVTDRNGIPHIDAASLDDLYFAWGFVTARDRLWQLEHMRRGAHGALWEWFGNRTLREDGGAQLFRLAERARAIWERESLVTETRVPLERFAAGVNAYSEECRSGRTAWPEEFRLLGRYPADWRPEDSILLLLAQGLVLDLAVPEVQESNDGAEVVARRRRFEGQQAYTTIPDREAERLYGHAEEKRAVARREPDAHGAATLDRALVARAIESLGRGNADLDPDERASNVFAVGPARGAHGKPVLANDPHLGLSTPGAFHVIHVRVPGIVDAIGATVPGLPAIVSGRNRGCAWGVTALSADVMDLYADTLSADGKRVRWNGGWRELEVRPFSMRYRLGPITIPLPGRHRAYTPHGPVLVTDKKKRIAYALRWAADDGQVTLARMLGVERSGTAAEVAERFQTLVTPGLNLVAADTTGDLVYQASGTLPRRGFTPSYGALPADGAHEWQGLIHGAEMPAWHAPSDGVVVNANNLPVGPAYPEPLPRFDWAHDRAWRIAERIEASGRVGIADLAATQNDVTSRAAARFVPVLIRCARAGSPSPRARVALDTLAAWDFTVRRDLVAPTLYRAWLGALQQRSKLGGLSGLTLAALVGEAPEALVAPKGGAIETPTEAALAALEVALTLLEKSLGPDLSSWTWDRAHRAEFAHALAWKDKTLSPPLTPADGDNSTPCVGRSGLPKSLTFSHGPVFRHVVDLGIADSSIGLVVPGNSGVAGGPHVGDLLERWADHAYVPFYLDWERIVAIQESELRLVPGGTR